MDLNDLYRIAGGDLNETLSRLGSERLLTRILEKFRSDSSLDLLEKALASRDGSAAFMAVHTLKGVALNLGFTALAEKSSDLTELLRPYSTLNSPASGVLSEETQKKSSELLAALREEYCKVKNAF